MAKHKPCERTPAQKAATCHNFAIRTATNMQNQVKFLAPYLTPQAASRISHLLGLLEAQVRRSEVKITEWPEVIAVPTAAKGEQTE